MQNERIFVGDIHKCTLYSKINHKVDDNNGLTYVVMKHKVYKKDVTLMKTKTGFFADIEGLNIRDMALIYNAGIGQNLLDVQPCGKEHLFVNEESLKSYNDHYGFTGKKFTLFKRKNKRS